MLWLNESTGSPSSCLRILNFSFVDMVSSLNKVSLGLIWYCVVLLSVVAQSKRIKWGCRRPLLPFQRVDLGFFAFRIEVWCLSESFECRSNSTFCHCSGSAKSNFLQVTKNRYLDYGIIRNATCHLTWAFIGVFESFLRRELKKTPYINVMA